MGEKEREIEEMKTKQARPPRHYVKLEFRDGTIKNYRQATGWRINDHWVEVHEESVVVFYPAELIASIAVPLLPPPPEGDLPKEQI